MKYEDKNQLYNRIIATYEKAVMQLKDFPEIWYDAAAYCISMNKNKEALSFLEMGMEIIPHR